MFISTSGKDSSVISKIAESIKNDPKGIAAQKASFVLAYKILNYKIREIDLGKFNTKLLPAYCFETRKEEGYSCHHRDSPPMHTLDTLVELIEVSNWNPFIHEGHLMSLLERADTYFEGDNLRIRFEIGGMNIYPDESPCIDTSLYILFSYWDRGLITDEDLTKKNPKIKRNSNNE